MYMEIEELKKHVPNTMSMKEYVASLKKVYDFEKNPRPADDIRNAYGTKPNVPGINVVNDIKITLGPLEVMLFTFLMEATQDIRSENYESS